MIFALRPTTEMSASRAAASPAPTAGPCTADTIGYSYLVTNDGNVSLTGPVTVADDKVAVTCPAVSTTGNSDAEFDPLETLICTALYTVTQADLNAGSVTNIAQAFSPDPRPPGGTVSSNTDTEIVTGTQTPSSK